ncbi:hypothetical protein MHYP_G00349680 [Metynnis hypsauchen]
MTEIVCLFEIYHLHRAEVAQDAPIHFYGKVHLQHQQPLRRESDEDEVQQRLKSINKPALPQADPPPAYREMWQGKEGR